MAEPVRHSHKKRPMEEIKKITIESKSEKKKKKKDSFNLEQLEKTKHCILHIAMRIVEIQSPHNLGQSTAFKE